MALLKMQLDGEDYQVDLDKLTLGEARRLKLQAGMKDLSQFNFFDPEQMVTLFAIAVKRKHPDMDEADVLAKIEELDATEILQKFTEQIEADAAKEEAEDPTAAVTASAADGSASDSSGPQATTPVGDGSQPSSASTE